MGKLDLFTLLNTYRHVLLFVGALVFVLCLHGAIPGLLLPTLSQAVWSAGFAQSFINQSPLSVHAVNFGLPVPAPIAFGLAGAYPMGLLIAAGLHPADAYAAMAAIWLTVAFFGAWRLGMLLGLYGPGAVGAAVLWMSMPIVWVHAGYSMLSLGIALLPFYLWVALQVITEQVARRQDVLRRTAVFLATCVIAVFMDGYSYVMFAVGVGLLGTFCFIRLQDLRRHLLVFALPVTIGGFALSYFLYTAYIGQSSFKPEEIEFFRGWGVDLTFLAVPTQGMHWFWDAVGLSVARSSQDFFGDASVWITTFAFPTLLLGLVAWWRVRRRVWLATGLLIVALFGLYMALGPSLKVNSVRPEAMIEAGDLSPLMPAELAVAPTGSAILSENLPGFQNMRAAYRWLALSIVGFWGLIVLGLGSLKSRTHLICGLGLVAALIIINLPHLGWKWQTDLNHRSAFLRIEDELVSEMRGLLHEGERVAFLPYRNDFLVNYIAARLKIRALNIGGDKNVDIAREHWPLTMRGFLMGQVDRSFADRVLLLLARQEADVVVFPYIDLLWAAHFWPAPVEFKEELAPVIADLEASGFVTIEERERYAVLRIAPEYLDELQNGTLCWQIMEWRGPVYPVRVEDPAFALLWMLGSGWHDLEYTHIWSGKEAELRMPVPPDAGLVDKYAVELVFSVYGASADRDVKIIFETDVNDMPVSSQLIFSSGALQRVMVPLPSGRVGQVVRISVPEATSPEVLQESQDTRILGIALRTIDLVRGGPDIRIGTVLRVPDFTEGTPTQVGILRDGSLVTTGRAGFLVFGPYVAMNAGEYSLMVKGTASSADSAWVDVVSGHGTVQHARFRLSSYSGEAPGILTLGRVFLAEPVDDLEVRVNVGENDEVRLEGYVLVPVLRAPLDSQR